MLKILINTERPHQINENVFQSESINLLLQSEMVGKYLPNYNCNAGNNMLYYDRRKHFVTLPI